MRLDQETSALAQTHRETVWVEGVTVEAVVGSSAKRGERHHLEDEVETGLEAGWGGVEAGGYGGERSVEEEDEDLPGMSNL